MRSLGTDSSSSSAGLALSVGGELSIKDVWRPPRKATRPQQLLDYHRFLFMRIAIWKPDVAVVLQIHSVRGSKTVRALSYFEGVTLLALAQHEIPIYLINDGTARGEVLGLPITASKQETVAAVKKRWPELKWSMIRTNKEGKLEGPGLDEIDAYVASLAWKVAEKV